LDLHKRTIRAAEKRQLSKKNEQEANLKKDDSGYNFELTVDRLANHFRTSWEDVSSWNIMYFKHKVEYVNYLDKMAKMKLEFLKSCFIFMAQDVSILEQMNSILMSEVIEPIKGSAPDIVLNWLQGRIDHAKEILKNDGRMTTSGALYQSIRESDLQLSDEGVMTVNVIAEQYWKYINYGVKWYRSKSW